MATICFVCEGAYPYVVGGVSAWVHELITSNPQHDFKILCIIPDEKFAKLKYQIPKNVIEIKNILMDSSLDFSYSSFIKAGLQENEEKKDSVKELIHFQIDGNADEKLNIIEKLFSKEMGSPLEIILSQEYWGVLLKQYKKYHEKGNFSIYYWTYRNIILNLLKIGQGDIPKADIYHCVTTGYAGFIGCLVAHRKMGKFLLTEHGIYPREREEEILGANEYTRGIQIQYGADEKKTKVIANGVDEKKYGNIVKKKREGFHIGSVLRVVPIKDIKMMIKGFKIAEKNMPDATLWLIGPTDEDEKYYEECLELVKNLELEEKVIFTGRADVLEYYAFLDLLILTSISEGQPLSILEGLASGIPFIATDVGNCREILLEKKDIGEAGLIIPPTSYTDLAEAFLKLYKNTEKLNEFSENGKKIVKKYYTKESFIGQYRELYEELGD